MPQGHITALLRRVAGGDRSAYDELMPLVERRLHARAEQLMRRERPDITLQPTALVNEVYLRLVQEKEIDCEDRGHFLRVAARKMRQILRNHVRDRAAKKRGGGWQRVPLDDHVAIGSEHAIDIVALDQALDRLEARDPRLAEIVGMRLFGGMETQEIAAVVERSTRTVERDLKAATLVLLNDVKNATSS